jgi:alcohol dehydrogenase class IV
MRWNRSSNAPQQQLISDAMGVPEQAAASALADLVKQLGLPQSLRDVGVARDAIPLIAAKAFGDILIKTNPRAVNSASDIQEVLETAF